MSRVPSSSSTSILRPIPDNPEAEERFPEVVMAELEDGSEASGMTETSRSSAAAEAASERFLPPLEVEEVAKGLVGVEVRFKDILASSNR